MKEPTPNNTVETGTTESTVTTGTGTATAAAAKKKTTFFHANPVMKRLTKVKESAGVDEKVASYGGITAKTGFFLLMTVVGMIAYLVAQVNIFSQQPTIEGLKYDNFEFAMSVPQALTLAGISVIAIIAQLLAGFIPKTIPVTGTIYSLAQGALISCIIFTVLGGEHMEHLGLLALIITIIVVVTMALLYTKGIVKVNKKFKTILLTLLLSSIGLSVIVLICSFIPGVNVFVASILGNFWVSILLTLLSIVIATLFLISEFAVMDEVVQNRLPVKYEWMAAFGLAFAILWIYVKILELVIRIAGSRK